MTPRRTEKLAVKKLSHAASLSIVALVSALALAAGANASEKVQAAKHENKSEAVAEGKKLVAAIDEKIEALKKDVSKSNAEVKKAHEANMKELQAKRKAAAAELDKLEKSAAGTWDATKQGFSKAYKDLQDAYDKAAANAKAK
jgi:uncharacterized protein HemX